MDRKELKKIVSDAIEEKYASHFTGSNTMTRDEAFDTIVTEFAKDMGIDSVSSKNKFVAYAPNGAVYLVTVSFKDRDPITEEPRYVKVTVVQGPHKMHQGQWVAIDNAARAAQVALATIRNTEYTVQGELL